MCGQVWVGCNRLRGSNKTWQGYVVDKISRCSRRYGVMEEFICLTGLVWSDKTGTQAVRSYSTPAPAHKLVLTHWPQTQRTCSFSLFEQDAWLHWVPSAETPQQELEHKRVQHVHTQRPDGLWLSQPQSPLSRAGRLNRDPVQAEGWARGMSKHKADGKGPSVGMPDQR